LLFLLWVALFQFLGNSTLGYVDTHSLFGWWVWVFTRGAEGADGSINVFKVLQGDEAYAWFVPFAVLILLWLKRGELKSLPKRVWWPALVLIVVAALAHVLGFMVQQARVSVLAFSLGLYGLTGLFWGPAWMRAALFPFFLLVFCVPIGSGGEALAVPLRLLATKLTVVVCQFFLGINVIQNGTQLFDPAGAYQYTVAAACSGIRSLTAILAFGVIYGYLSFNSMWRRLVIVASAVPLAVVANVFRLSLIVLAAEAFGQEAGNYVHESGLFSLAPYIPAIVGMLLLGWLLNRRRTRKDPEQPIPIVVGGAGQNS
jgi:exosortase